MKDTRTRLVVGRGDTVVLRDVVFKVSEAGRARVLRECKKYVHAGAVGVVVPMQEWGEPAYDIATWQRIRYNPYTEGAFIREDGTAIACASVVRLTPYGVFIPGGE